MRIERGLNVRVLELLEKLLPLLISLASVCVATAAVLVTRRNAYRQAAFMRKADAYEAYLTAFAAYAYDPENPKKRSELTHALYKALLYCPVKEAQRVNGFVELALRTEPENISAFDKIPPDLLQVFRTDLRKTWRGNPLDKKMLLQETPVQGTSEKRHESPN